MKKILKFLIYLNLLLFIFFLFYTNKEAILELIVPKREIVIKESNKYKRTYDYTTFKVSNDFIPNNKEDILNIIYNILNNGYDTFTFYCDDEYNECFDDVIKISNDDSLISKIVNYVSPLNSYENFNTTVDNQGKIKINVNRTYNEQDINYIDSTVESIISSLNINSSDGDLSALTKVHNYIIDNVTYDKSLQKNKAINALRDKTATCNGYANLLSIFLDKLNIPNFKVSSDNHLWNAVYIDGIWKHVDSTWNDTNDKNHHLFFLIDTTKLLSLDKEEHNFDIEFYKELK
ncbi:MAG: transglutaminase-like domain-containing protein [Bacilli bacterium]